MNKVATLDVFVDQVRDAESISFGGGGIIRKPLSAAAAVGLSDIAAKDVFALLGGPEIDLLIGRDKVRSLLFAYVGMDSVGLAPNFRRAREGGHLAVTESSEYLVLAGLEASARGVPFIPTHSGLGTDVLTRSNTPYKTFACPITGQTLVASPALRADIGVIHVNVADVRGNSVIYGEAFADLLISRAVRSLWITAEKVVDELPPIDNRPAGFFIPRLFVAGVVESPGGAGFTGIFPDYDTDIEAAEEYRDNATRSEWLQEFLERTAAPSRAVVA